MATHRVSLLGPHTLPDDSGDVFWEPAQVKTTNDFFKHGNWILNNSGNDDELFGVLSGDVPQNYVGNASLIIVWTTTATSGDVEFGFAYRAVGGNDAESLDQSSAQESLLTGNNDTAPNLVNERMEFSIALTSSNLAPGDTFQWIFSREGADAGDTMSAALRIIDIQLEYDDV